MQFRPHNLNHEIDENLANDIPKYTRAWQFWVCLQCLLCLILIGIFKKNHKSKSPFPIPEFSGYER